MSHQVVLVTGAAGFLGSATTVDLARDHKVVALDRRKPSRALVDAAPDATWWQVDVSDAPTMASVFARTKETLGRIGFVVHFAAFYHFGTAWLREYERTNVQGTDNLLKLATEDGVSRVIFASSGAALRPPPSGERLTEKTVTAGYIPYAESKSIGESMVRETSERLPGIVLRIGGAFSDWCELPPLSSLIRQWAGRSPLRRLVVGRGKTGIPFIHRVPKGWEFSTGFRQSWIASGGIAAHGSIVIRCEIVDNTPTVSHPTKMHTRRRCERTKTLMGGRR